MALAHLGRWPSAQAALQAGARQCPAQERFPVELAGVAFEQKHYPEAAVWLRRALRLNPTDKYANNFAGTVEYLLGNVPAALHYWNRVGKPSIDALDTDPNLRVRQLLLSRAFAFSPAAVLTEPQFETSLARLNSLGIFSSPNIVLTARPDGSFDAGFHAMERDGFGAGLFPALVSTFSGLPYETVYPACFNIDRSAINAQSLLRWDSQKRRAWAQLSGPLRNLPANRWQFSADLRNENWAIRRSFTGPSPLLGALNLRWERADAQVHSIVSGRLGWSLGAEFSHRSFRSVVDGSALNANLLLPGYALSGLASVDGKLLDLPQRRFSLSASAGSETTRLWSSPPQLFEKLQGSALADWFPSKAWEVGQRVRAGRLMGTAPFDQLFVLGLERDTDLWLRGHLATRDGKKGSGPIGDGYFLANSDLDRRIYSNGLLGIAAGPLLDIGRAWAPTSGLAPAEWLCDTGLQARLTVLGTQVVLSWGWDLRNGQHAFFGAAE